jgi:hypothetical protein
MLKTRVAPASTIWWRCTSARRQSPKMLTSVYVFALSGPCVRSLVASRPSCSSWHPLGRYRRRPARVLAMDRLRSQRWPTAHRLISDDVQRRNLAGHTHARAREPASPDCLLRQSHGFRVASAINRIRFPYGPNAARSHDRLGGLLANRGDQGLHGGSEAAEFAGCGGHGGVPRADRIRNSVVSFSDGCSPFRKSRRPESCRSRSVIIRRCMLSCGKGYVRRSSTGRSRESKSKLSTDR